MPNVSLGILGGMGPKASIVFCKRLVDLACERNIAGTDQDHLPFCLVMDPRIPDRSDAILGIGRSPVIELLNGIVRLKALGVTDIAIPCNTAHAWYNEIASAAAPARVIHIVDAVSYIMRVNRLPTGPVGLLATRGTINANIYQDRLAKQFPIVVPNDIEQDIVDCSIKLAKSGRIQEANLQIKPVISEVLGRGLSVLISGCTEISLMTEPMMAPVLIDSTEALAAYCISHWVRGKFA